MVKHLVNTDFSRQRILNSLLSLLLIAPMLLLPQAFAEDFSVSSGHSAHWFSLERAGEGLVLEIMSPELALLYWFTYDEDGNQRWLTNVGHIDGRRIIFDELLVTRGGRFGPDFDPDEVEIEVVGQAELVFSDCENLVFNYSAFGQSESIEMIRLTQTMAAGCQPLHGVPGEPVRAYAGQSGSWYDRNHVGEGYTLQWMSRDEAVLVWFSYDEQGNQYWMIGNGKQVDDEIHFGMLHSARGGRFGEDFDSSEVELIEWGSLVLELDCMSGTAAYESLLPEFGSGSFVLERLSFLDQPACPWTTPKLSDLYDIDLITVYEGTNHVHADDINDDGLIVALYGTPDGSVVARRGLDDDEWELLHGLFSHQSARMSPDGSVIIAGKSVSTPTLHFQTMLWDAESGWRELPDLIFPSSVYRAASRDRTRIVGTGQYGDGDYRQYPWIWDEEHGQMEWTLVEGNSSVFPNGVSNDGKSVIAVRQRLSSGDFPTVQEVAVRLVNDGEMHILKDHLGYELRFANACSADCSVAVGMEQTDSDPDHPHFREAWVWSDDGRMAYLGAPPEAVHNATVAPATPTGVSADGTVVTGNYPMFNPGNRPGTRGFIWTQNTGMISTRELFEEIDLGDDNWDFMSIRAVSSDGRKILIGGYHRPTQFSPTNYRVMVLTLAERD